ncbi:MAG: hypothetical protein WCB50_19945 [Pseudolabrys sp.]
MRACSASSGDIISPGSATSGGSIFADSATSVAASSAGLSPEFFREDSLIDDVLSEGFPDFFVRIPGDLILDPLASLDFAGAVVFSNDRASELFLTAVFFVGDLTLPMR